MRLKDNSVLVCKNAQLALDWRKWTNKDLEAYLASSELGFTVASYRTHRELLAAPGGAQCLTRHMALGGLVSHGSSTGVYTRCSLQQPQTPPSASGPATFFGRLTDYEGNPKGYDVLSEQTTQRRPWG